MTTKGKDAFINMWLELCKQGMPAEKALIIAQLKTKDLCTPDEQLDIVDILTKERGIDIDKMCEMDETFALFVSNARMAQKDAQIARQKAVYQNVVAKITKHLTWLNNDLTAGEDFTPTLIEGNLKAITDAINEASSTAAIEKRVRTSKELLERMRNQPQGYKSGVFGITFPVDTLSFIGARMSRGKTAALTSIAIDALFPLTDKNGKSKDEPHNVLFITREETDGQIARRLILCKAWRDAEGKTYGNDNMQDLLLNVLNPYWGKGDSEQDKHDPKQCYNAWIKGILKPDTPSTDLFIKAIQAATKEVSQAIDSERLAIFDGAGASALEERAYLNKITAKTVVLYDYIQLAPADGGIAADAYAKKAAIADADKAIINAMKTHRGIAIAGAQFNRTGTQQGKDIDPKRDEFSESAFADCSNLENDAHIAIGIGWEKDDTGVASKRFWKLLKNREGGGVGSTQKELDARGIGYSYLKSTGEVAYSKSGKGENNEANYTKTIKAGKGIIEVTD